jgi:catechol 2,3-dioxygenase-like lactoylglutathione lyase family enzyme
VVAGAAAVVGAAFAAVKRLSKQGDKSDEEAATASNPSSGAGSASAPGTGPAAAPSTGLDQAAVNAPLPTPTRHPGSGTSAMPDHAGPAERAGSGRSASGSGPWADLTGRTEVVDPGDEAVTAYPNARPGATASIHGVGVTVPVTDLARSVAFYREVLGFFVIDQGRASAVLASGDTRLVLRTVPDLSTEGARLISVNLEVGDVEAIYQELRAKGVEFLHEPRPVNRGDRLELWSAMFRDPDDHNIAITQWRAAR